MTTNDQFVTYDYLTNTLTTCPVGSNFNTGGWIQTDCEVHTSMPQFADCFIQLVEDNWHAKLITWVHADGSYAGISAWSRELGRAFKEEGVTGALINRHFYQVTTKEFIIRDLNYDSLVLKGNELPNRGPNSVVVTAKDDDGTDIEQMVATRMQDAFDEVTYDIDHHLPEINTYGATTFYVPLFETDFYGNNLNFSVAFEGDVSGYVDSRTYTTFASDVFYIFKSGGSKPDFSEVSFTKNFAIGSDKYNQVITFFSCGLGEIEEVRCDELYIIPTQTQVTLKMYSREVLDHVFTWMTTTQKTMVFVLGKQQNQIYSFELDGVASDAHAVVVKGRLYIFVSYESKNVVYVKDWSPVNPKYFGDLPSITTGSSNLPYFCPNDIFDTYDGNRGYLEVVSSCRHTVVEDQRIFRFNLTTMMMAGSHPINLNIADPQVCAVGDSYIISSRVNNIVEGRN